MEYSMSGTKAGGAKAALTNKTKDPDFYKRIGSKGGKAGTGHAFGHGKVDPHEAGKVGGTISKRGRSKDTIFTGEFPKEVQSIDEELASVLEENGLESSNGMVRLFKEIIRRK